MANLTHQEAMQEMCSAIKEIDSWFDCERAVDIFNDTLERLIMSGYKYLAYDIPSEYVYRDLIYRMTRKIAGSQRGSAFHAVTAYSTYIVENIIKSDSIKSDYEEKVYTFTPHDLFYIHTKDPGVAKYLQLLERYIKEVFERYHIGEPLTI